ncbi:hypothetical protein OFO01_02110 [Campylobacter sp. JMF_01 NE2]|uniref:hypothetical protein n=1 Tax=unclassified Campylobacter TaxID=2593542 RepID=UPI0022E9FDC5|nr:MULTISPECIES: hypothetical protein [unclassified Campylobacter]MDA3052250.1 hypothetical protein [Campylobacter sp. JMF_03 NE3]MDA3066584.1 hypothetical protein [Campylobacter sp. JMF_01 NE2]
MKRREFIKNTAIFGTMAVFSVANLSPNLKENLSKFAKNHKILIVYYTRTLNTKIIAEYLAWLVGGDLFALHYSGGATLGDDIKAWLNANGILLK